MAELTVFSFRPGSSLVHRLDARFKLVSLLLVSVSSLKAGTAGLSLMLLVFVFLVFYLRIPLSTLLRDIKYFLLLLAAVFTARSLSGPGDPVFELSGLSVTPQGLCQGIMVCMRLLLLMLAGLCFISTSRSSEIRGAAAWFLRPFPLVNGNRAATMLSLIIRFVSVIFDQASRTSEAQRARAVENRKNPVYRLRKFAVPFMRRTFEDADRLVEAMEARCYTEDRTGPEFSAGKTDWAAMAAVALICLFAVYL